MLVPYEPSAHVSLDTGTLITCGFYDAGRDSLRTLVRIASGRTTDVSGEQIAELRLDPPLDSATGYACNVRQPANEPLHGAPG